MKACSRWWGTWENICRAAGVEHLSAHVPRGYWTRDRVIEVLRKHVRDGRSVTANALGPGIASAVWRHFGGLGQALTAANARL
jgi:hypothetical protein